MGLQGNEGNEPKIFSCLHPDVEKRKFRSLKSSVAIYLQAIIFKRNFFISY